MNKTFVQINSRGDVAVIQYSYPLPFRILYDPNDRLHEVTIKGEYIKGMENIKRFVQANYEELSAVSAHISEIQFLSDKYKKRARILAGFEYREIQRAIDALPKFIYTIEELLETH